jgi:serine/threonine-protein kinase
MVDLFLNRNNSRAYRIEDYIVAASGRTYEIADRIDSGGNGVVHKCLDAATGEECAVKFLLSHRNVDQTRFEKELRLMQTVEHQHLIKYIDSGTVDATLVLRGKEKKQATTRYVVMELADGTLFERYEPIDWAVGYESYISQFRGLSEALAQIHSCALHRDIKPHNILIKGDTWLISDFGLCIFNEDDADPALTIMDRPFGPKYWMSPEALNRIIGRPEPIVMASDVFQLAAIFWLVVNHRHPAGVLTEEDWRGPENLYAVLNRALQHDPNRRQQSGKEFLEELVEAIAV